MAPTPVLAAAWCRSVGTTWTLELRELDGDTGLGPIVDWISSGLPITQPAPDALAHELLATRGLRLFHTSADPGTRSRHRIGYVCADAELITLAHLVRDDAAEAGAHPVPRQTSPAGERIHPPPPITSSDTAGPAGDNSTNGLAPCTPDELLRLTVQRPAVGVCVVTVDGELDMLTAPLLQACVRKQLAAVPAHLILDLQTVRFLGLNGLTCLLQARELALQTTRSQLHLAGLVTRLVARPLEITGLLGLFDPYPTVAEALAALAD